MNDIEKADKLTAAGDKVLALIRTEFPQYHPILAIARLAHDDALKEDPRLQLECHKTLVRFVTPELKSMEVKAEIKETRRVIVSLFDGEDTGGHVFENGEATPRITAHKPDPLWQSLEFEDAEMVA